MLGGLALLSAPADAGPTAIVLEVAKQKDGPYAEFVTANVDPGEAKNFYLKVRNASGIEQPVTMGQYTEEPLKAHWFEGFNRDNRITADVEPYSHEFSVAPGGVKRFLWRVKVIGGAGCSSTVVSWPGPNFDSAAVLISGDPNCDV